MKYNSYGHYLPTADPKYLITMLDGTDEPEKESTKQD